MGASKDQESIKSADRSQTFAKMPSSKFINKSNRLQRKIPLFEVYVSSLLHSGNSYLILFPAAVSIDGGGWAVGGRGVGRAVGGRGGGGREGGRWGGGSGEAGSKKIHETA